MMASLDSVKAVIFDADGTLVDSEEMGLDVLHELANKEGAKLSRVECNHLFRGIRMAEVTRKIASLLPHSNATFETEFTARVRAATLARMQQSLSALPGAHALLKALQVPFCVATNGPREKVEMTMELTGLRPMLRERIFTAYEVGSFKPEPGLFLHAAAALQTAPQHCAVVEDSIAGIQAGLAAGMQVFSLHPPAGLPSDWSEKITTIRDLPDLHQKLQHLCSVAA